MKRRKVLLGMGSLAAGSAAAMGTGAFTQATLSDRSVNVDVVADNTAFASLLSSDSGLDNDEYATNAGQGKLKLMFNEDALVDSGGFLADGTGLNKDAEYFFDNVFGYASRIDDSVTATIDWSGLDHSNRFVFYDLPQQGRPSEVDPQGDYTEGLPGTGSGSYVGVGIGIDTSGVDLQEGWETGSIKITFEN